MQKEKYELAQLNVIAFKMEDVILFSDPDYEDDETPVSQSNP